MIVDTKLNKKIIPTIHYQPYIGSTLNNNLVQKLMKTLLVKDFSDMHVHKRLFHTPLKRNANPYLACIVG
jgi:hypothetical protein